MKSIFVILKKELKRNFTSVRNVLGMILPGILIFVIYSLMGTLTNKDDEKKDTSFIVRIENVPNDLNDFATKNGLEFKNIDGISNDEFKEKIKNKEADMLVIYPASFKTSINELEDGKDVPNVEIYYNTSKDESSEIYNLYTSYLNSFESKKCNLFDINNDQNVTYDFATKEEASKKFISLLLPYVLIIFLVTSSIAYCSDAFAGEKERGTIATLLMTPTKRSEIAIGKILSLSVCAIVSATASFIGLLLSLSKLVGSEGNGFSISMYSFGTYVLLFLVIIATTLFFVSLLAVVSAYAKNVKEASTLAAPISILVTLIGLSSLIGNSSNLQFYYYLIPIYNSVNSLSCALSGNIHLIDFGITIISNIVFVLGFVFLLGKMLNSEKVMFKK